MVAASDGGTDGGKRRLGVLLAAIGAAIGGRNHATVLHSCKAVTNMIETDKVFKSQIEEIEKLILGK